MGFLADPAASRLRPEYTQGLARRSPGCAMLCRAESRAGGPGRDSPRRPPGRRPAQPGGGARRPSGCAPGPRGSGRTQPPAGGPGGPRPPVDRRGPPRRSAPGGGSATCARRWAATSPSTGSPTWGCSSPWWCSSSSSLSTTTSAGRSAPHDAPLRLPGVPRLLLRARLGAAPPQRHPAGGHGNRVDRCGARAGHGGGPVPGRLLLPPQH